MLRCTLTRLSLALLFGLPVTPLAAQAPARWTLSAELRIGIYKDAAARFADAQPADYEMQVVKLTEEERSAILATLYGALERRGTYPDATKRDPDPEKITEAK
jgi:hypothetical protein